jgi:hypothetical protein
MTARSSVIIAALLGLWVGSWFVAFTGFCGYDDWWGENKVAAVFDDDEAGRWESENAFFAAIPIVGLAAAAISTQGFWHGLRWGVRPSSHFVPR